MITFIILTCKNFLYFLSFPFFYIFVSALIHTVIILFCSTPFELHDDNYVLKAMNFCQHQMKHPESESGEGCSVNALQPIRSSTPNQSQLPTLPPLPGIIKARGKYEHQDQHLATTLKQYLEYNSPIRSADPPFLQSCKNPRV